MSWWPKLIALDIDGTLSADGQRITPAVRAAVSSAVAAGAQVVLSTGRTVLSAAPAVAELGLSGALALCSNGAVWLDTGTGRVVRAALFDPAEPVRVLRALLPDALFLAEQIGVGFLVTGSLPAGLASGRLTVVEFAELVATPTPRVTAMWPDRSAAELAAAVAGVRVPGVHYSLDHTDAWLTATPAGVTKGSALEELRLELGVPATETLAVGDSFNDVEMLSWAARGVAMGQAPAAVRAVADEVTESVDADGVAVLLRRWFE